MNSIKKDRLRMWDEGVQPYIDELVIGNLWGIVRLIGLADDDDDYYYVYIDPKNQGKEHLIALSSCCGGHTKLKGKIPDAEYEKLEKSFKVFDEICNIELFLKNAKIKHNSIFNPGTMVETRVFLKREDI